MGQASASKDFSDRSTPTTASTGGAQEKSRLAAASSGFDGFATQAAANAPGSIRPPRNKGLYPLAATGGAALVERSSRTSEVQDQSDRCRH